MGEDTTLPQNWFHFLQSKRAAEDIPPQIPEFTNHRTASLALAVNAAVRFVPPQCKCIFLDVIAKTHLDIQKMLREILEKKPSLEEIRLKFLNGTIIWAARTPEGIISEVEVLSDEDPIFNGTDRPPDEVLRLRLLTPWKLLTANTPENFPELLRKLRENRGLYPEEVVKEVLRDPDGQLSREVVGVPEKRFGLKKLKGLEGGRDVIGPVFPFLKRLAETYHVDVRKLIPMINKRRYPDLPPRTWSTPQYPIYLEDRVDAARIRRYQGALPERSFGSFGWLVWSARKNPWRYMSMVGLAKKLGVSRSTINQWEENRSAPSPELVVPLAKILQIPQHTLVRALNNTFHPGLDIRPVFGDLPIYLFPDSQDGIKVRGYLARPGTLGQWAFALRKMLPDAPHPTTLSQRLRKGRTYVDSREFNKIALDPNGLADWVQLFASLGAPMELIRQSVEAQGLKIRDQAWLVARGAKGRSIPRLAEAGSLEKRTIERYIKDPGAVLLPATILNMAQSMAPEAGTELYLSVYPKAAEIFPEAGGEKPCLAGTSEEFKAAMVDFNLPERLFEFRMAPPDLAGVRPQRDGTLNYRSAAKLAGIEENSWRRYERGYHWIAKDEDLQKLAGVLGVDPRVLYIHYRPEILRLFPLQLPSRDEPAMLDSRKWYGWYRDVQQDFDRSNLRRKLSPRLVPVMAQRGFKDGGDYLRDALAAHRGLAEKVLDSTQPLTPAEMKIMDDILPRGPGYREWFEHYYRPELQFFLGRGEGGGYDYALPKGLTWEAFKGWDIPQMLQNSLKTKSVSQGERNTFLEILREERRYGRGTFPVNNIPFLSRISGMSRKLLYLWSRRVELEPMLGRTL